MKPFSGEQITLASFGALEADTPVIVDLADPALVARLHVRRAEAVIWTPTLLAKVLGSEAAVYQPAPRLSLLALFDQATLDILTLTKR